MKKLLALLLVLPALAFAEVSPQPGQYDPRVRVVAYNPLDVVHLVTYYGVSTHIKFGDGEVIEDKSIGAGDPKAWHINPSKNGNNLFVMPREKNADMNMTVITNKRVYQFVLTVDPHPLKEGSKTWESNMLTYSLSFTYPDEEAAKAALQKHAVDVKKRLDTIKQKMNDVNSDCQNVDYWMAGSNEISPTAACDNGRFIRLTFSNNRDMPAVYTVDDEGNEALVNTNVEGNTIVVQRIVRKLKLRKGNSVVCIVNKSFDPDGGSDNKTGTIAPDVERVIKGAQ